MFSATDALDLSRSVHAVMKSAAARAIMPRYRQLGAGDICEKAADELVTIADRESETILGEGLAAILPNAAIVGEEAVDADPTIGAFLGAPLCWIVDPLDGTANFAAGTGPFGVLVALAAHGRPIGGWVYDPTSGRFCAAVTGHGATINGLPPPAALPRQAGLPSAAISILLKRSDRHAAVVGALFGMCEMTEAPRCAAEQYPRLMTGHSDVALFERTLPWDHAAGVVCLTEAGGRAARFDGSEYRVDDDRVGLIAAATPELLDRFLDRLGPFG